MFINNVSKQSAAGLHEAAAKWISLLPYFNVKVLKIQICYPGKEACFSVIRYLQFQRAATVFSVSLYFWLFYNCSRQNVFSPSRFWSTVGCGFFFRFPNHVGCFWWFCFKDVFFFSCFPQSTVGIALIIKCIVVTPQELLLPTGLLQYLIWCANTFLATCFCHCGI